MKKFLSIFLDGYRLAISPLLMGLGCNCRFHPSCSNYARHAIARHPWPKALGLIIKRLFKCGPWHPGGVDFVPIPIRHKDSGGFRFSLIRQFSNVSYGLRERVASGETRFHGSFALRLRSHFYHEE